ncbi:hypothetical protein [Clostridium beijerinckii]|uniref:Archaellum component FlaC n=1 Tax=Clostridium beijerinckii TaxID=1520 RepID=A0AAX0B128_CLOBE|nr:hypothetical protein [Clostridium beijerinckii]NRT88736.1 archaellum component FlaC [Clostridium beijerinckii]NYC74191.1 archaellum component FlaC [Clostridium beijerinckii]
MKSINDAIRALKDISKTINSDDVKERLSNVIYTLNKVQDEIYNDLNSFDAYSEGRDEIGSIIDELLEKVDPVQYNLDNSWHHRSFEDDAE